MRIKYLIRHIPVTESANNIPFTISIPSDVEAVIGVAVNNNARVNVGGGDEIAWSVLGSIASKIVDAQKLYERTAILKGRFTYYPIEGSDYRAEVQLNRFALGNVSLRSYERSGQFYSQTILPSHFNLGFCGTAPGGAFRQGQFRVRTHENKSKIFVPVNIAGTTTEIQGFIEPFDFGKAISSSTDELYKANTDFVNPYQASIYLLCTI